MPSKKGFQLQDHDIEILHYVFQLRLATVHHLAVLSGRSVRALWGRLLKLTKRRYLSAVTRHMQKKVYGLGSEGIAALVEHGYAPEEMTQRRLRNNELREIGIRHSLFVADIHTKILMLTRNGSVTLAHWQEGAALWDSVPPRGTDPAIPIRPDAYFILKQGTLPEGNNAFHIFLEADRSTMAHARMAAKITGYLAYHAHRQHIRKYPAMKTFVVTTVTETRRRADELRKSLHSMIPPAARGAYHFVAFEDLALVPLLPKAASGAP